MGLQSTQRLSSVSRWHGPLRSIRRRFCCHVPIRKPSRARRYPCRVLRDVHWSHNLQRESSANISRILLSANHATDDRYLGGSPDLSEIQA